MPETVSWQQYAETWEQIARSSMATGESYKAQIEDWKKIAEQRAANATMEAATRARGVAQKTAAALATFAKRQQELELELKIAKAEMRNMEERHASEVRIAEMIHAADMRHVERGPNVVVETP